MKKLILTVGLPKSGKTTWAMSQNCPVVNLSAIRKAFHGQRYIREMEPWIWNLSKTMIKALLLAGHDTVILDGCNNTLAQRDPWKDLDIDLIEFKVFSKSKEDCIQIAKDQNDFEVIQVIEEMFSNHEPLTKEEKERELK